MLSQVGYQGFGSFHSDNVEELIRQSVEEFKAPTLPVTPDASSLEELRGMEFGLPARKFFMIDFAQWTFVNHGGFCDARD